MYNLPIIGAVAVDLDGTPIGIVHAIEHSAEGVSIYVFTGEEGDDGAKDDIPSESTISKLRAVAGKGSE